jgi:hypothetical protein
MGSAPPPRGSSTSWSSSREASPVLPSDDPSSSFGPGFRVLPGFRAVGRSRLLLLSRGFVPPQRNPTTASHQPRTLPVRVLLRPCRSRRLRRLAPAMISRMCFKPARSRGFLPSELDLTAIVHASRRDIPSCDWHPACRRGPKTVCGGCASPDTRADSKHPQMPFTARLIVPGVPCGSSAPIPDHRSPFA